MTPQETFDHHIQTGEPLAREEVFDIVAAGIADDNDFANVGGDLYRYDPLDSLFDEETQDGFGDSIEAAEYYAQMAADNCSDHAP